jgi:GNAT superfamily N-acetyltransferase
LVETHIAGFEDGMLFFSLTRQLFRPPCPEIYPQILRMNQIFYIGEVMVRADSRGKGSGTKLLSKMLDLINISEFKTVCFYTVIREENHPLKPSGYRSLEPLWKRYGFIKDPLNIAQFRWKDLGDTTETFKQMNVWFKKL